MEMQEIIEVVRGFEGALVFVPEAGGPYPEIAWGDAFCYFAPDGVMPERTQPYATIVTKDYPDDERSRLDEPGRFRVNLHVGRDRAAELAAEDADPAEADAFAPHPLYGAAGWVSVVNPSTRTAEQVLALLRDAHDQRAAERPAASARNERTGMASPQALSESDRRVVADWAAACAERVLAVFEAEAPEDGRPRDAIARARAFARGDLDAAGEIRRRFVAGRAAGAVRTPAAVAAARAAAQAAGVAHMGAHALGAAAYAAKAAGLAAPDRPDATDEEVRWQVAQLSPEAADALRRLPPVGADSHGPLGAGLLASGVLGSIIRDIQAAVGSSDDSDPPGNP
ncbi:DUF6194 family protein [Agromyces sp. MMS24-JH15]|uniref:DUF6194 family protein n=1 Tax=Agromyces sp. MMS24-JH15 TaxID=3243765 RepID=UPI003747F62F